jgi:hypothetical protein
MADHQNAKSDGKAIPSIHPFVGMRLRSIIILPGLLLNWLRLVLNRRLRAQVGLDLSRDDWY